MAFVWTACMHEIIMCSLKTIFEVKHKHTWLSASVLSAALSGKHYAVFEVESFNQKSNCLHLEAAWPCAAMYM